MQRVVIIIVFGMFSSLVFFKESHREFVNRIKQKTIWMLAYK